MKVAMNLAIESGTDSRRPLLDLPDSFPASEYLNTYSPEERSRYFRSLLLEILKLNPDGFSASDLWRTLRAKKLVYSRDTLNKHLSHLVGTREAYSTRHGVSVIYHPNGKMMWEGLKDGIVLGNKSYTFASVDNPRGEFIFIQEREDEGGGTSTVTGGLIVPKQECKKFIDALAGFLRRVDGGSSR